MNQRTILVIGATGAMGRPVVEALLGDREQAWHVRAFTRNPDSEQAQALAALDLERVSFARGDLDDAASVRWAMDGAYGGVCNTNFWSSSSVEAEYRQGVDALEAAKDAGVEHFVYSSLDSMSRMSGGRFPCPHFEAKAAVEAYIDRRRSDDVMRAGRSGYDGDDWYRRATSVVVTLPYMDNFLQFAAPQPGTLSDGREGLIWRMPLSPEQPWPVIALSDLAHFVALMFANSEWKGRTLAIGSDSLTMPEVAETFTRVTGIPAEYQPMTLEAFSQLPIPNMHDLLLMWEFFNHHRLERDHAALRAIHPELMTFADWLKRSGWRGQQEALQKDPIAGTEG